MTLRDAIDRYLIGGDMTVLDCYEAQAGLTTFFPLLAHRGEIVDILREAIGCVLHHGHEDQAAALYKILKWVRESEAELLAARREETS